MNIHYLSKLTILYAEHMIFFLTSTYGNLFLIDMLMSQVDEAINCVEFGLARLENQK
jgi:hypothetical protein